MDASAGGARARECRKCDLFGFLVDEAAPDRRASGLKTPGELRHAPAAPIFLISPTERPNRQRPKPQPLDSGDFFASVRSQLEEIQLHRPSSSFARRQRPVEASGPCRNAEAALPVRRRKPRKNALRASLPQMEEWRPSQPQRPLCCARQAGWLIFCRA